MANSWDVYSVTSSGGTITLAAGSATLDTSVQVTDDQHPGQTIETGADTVSDNGANFPLSGLTFDGTITIGAVTAFVVDDGNGNFGIFVPAGSDVSAGVTGATLTAAGAGNEWVLCFTAGTMIATPDGERAVETLAAGDLVTTADGSAKPVRWLGRSTKSTMFADPVRVLPVRIMAGALGENLPTRDLLVSPGHAMMIDGVLVHASALVNGTTVVRETGMPEVFTYFHVELDSHELLVAEGVATESFLLNVEDMGFDNFADRPAVSAQATEMSHPRVKSARQLPRSVRDLLSARAAVLVPDVALAA